MKLILPTRLASLALALSLTACAAAQPIARSEPGPGEDAQQPFGDRIVLKPGGEAILAPGTRLVLERIASDSRCPQGVQCIWAGEVTLAMALHSAAGKENFQLSGTAPEQRRGGWTVTLLEYGPCPGGPAITPLPGECAQLRATRD